MDRVAQPVEATQLLRARKQRECLGQHGLGGDKAPAIVLEEAAAARMQRVLLVEEADQEAGVNDDAFHARSPGSASAAAPARRSSRGARERAAGSPRRGFPASARSGRWGIARPAA